MSVYVCACNSEKVLTVYKLYKLMYCAAVQACVKIIIIDSIHVRFNHLCSFLHMKCVHKLSMNFTKLVAVSTIILF